MLFKHRAACHAVAPAHSLASILQRWKAMFCASRQPAIHAYHAHLPPAPYNVLLFHVVRRCAI